MITLSGLKKFFDAIDSGHTWKCVVAGSEIKDVKKDRESSVIIEGYDFSEKAVYFEGRYLPPSVSGAAAAASGCRFLKSGWITAQKIRLYWLWKIKTMWTKSSTGFVQAIVILLWNIMWIPTPD